MQLDDFKAVWQQQAQRASSIQHQLDVTQLEEMLKVRTAQALAKVNKLFIAEMGILLFVALGFSAAALWKANDSLIMGVFGVTMLVVVATASFMWRRYRELGRLGTTATNLRESLITSRSFLKRFMKQYTYVASLACAVALIYGIVTGASAASGKLLEELLLQPRFLKMLLPVSLVFIGGFYLLVRYSMKKIYGKHLQVIEHNLQELDQSV